MNRHLDDENGPSFSKLVRTHARIDLVIARPPLRGSYDRRLRRFPSSTLLTPPLISLQSVKTVVQTLALFMHAAESVHIILIIQTLALFMHAAESVHIILITKENPGSFSFAGSMHGCLDCTMKTP
jgi:hypothetical protein